jgi:hypothetical protein
MTRPITECRWDGGELVITGVLDDGTTDSDGQAIDPAWLQQAAAYWLAHWPNIHAGLDPWTCAGTGEAVWADGSKTMLRARITDTRVARMVVAEVITELTFGIMKPVIHPDPDAPAGRIVRGTLAAVGLAEPPFTAADQGLQKNPGK